MRRGHGSQRAGRAGDIGGSRRGREGLFQSREGGDQVADAGDCEDAQDDSGADNRDGTSEE
jgi:hypothetical protein